MNQRVQQVLDGELDRQALTPDERAALEEAEALLGSVVRAVPDPVLPSLAPGVLRRIAATADPAAQSPRRSFVAWLTTPRPLLVNWRPAYGLALAAALGLILLVTLPADSPDPTATTPHRVLVQFRLDAPDARHVALAGDFTDWKPAYTLRRSEPGVWTIVVPLAPGVHDYAFVVDGQRWQADPMAPAIADGFGGLNSRLAVMAPEQGNGI